MTRPLAILGQALAYLLFAAVLGVFSAAPSYTHLEPDRALIKLSFSHAAQRKGECRRLTPEEIAALPVLVELVLDGRVVARELLPPAGLHGDGASAVYRRFPVKAGRHRLVARLRDSGRTEGFDYEGVAEIELAPGQNFVVDFRSETGGFIFM